MKKPPPELNPCPKTVLSDSEIICILTLAPMDLTSPAIITEVSRGQKYRLPQPWNKVNNFLYNIFKIYFTLIIITE